METPFVESSYPLNFRLKDAKTLGEHLRVRHCVELVGIKHVGVSNFLRFFLYHEKIVKTYISGVEKHMFVEVDLNDLVERDVFAFWTLTFKRLADKVEHYGDIPTEHRKKISALFLDSIQSRNFFLTAENLREALKILVEKGIAPTIFFLRFDRLRDAVSEEFLANLEGLRAACAEKLAYVFTSYRALDDLAPAVFSRRSLSVFSHVMYIKPAQVEDIKVIFATFDKKYNTNPGREMLGEIMRLSGGHVQYLQIALIILSGTKTERRTPKNLLSLLVHDERVWSISEEIWESLSDSERGVVRKIVDGVEDGEGEESIEYLVETGILAENGKTKIFSPLFEYFVGRILESKAGRTVDFTKKENLLFNLLFSDLGQICERETIIKTVWPEYEEVGVSDWTIDQLVARLRTKLKLQKSQYEVKTVRTRGYRLVEES